VYQCSCSCQVQVEEPSLCALHHYPPASASTSHDLLTITRPIYQQTHHITRPSYHPTHHVTQAYLPTDTPHHTTSHDLLTSRHITSHDLLTSRHTTSHRPTYQLTRHHVTRPTYQHLIPLDRGRFVVVHPCSTFSECCQLTRPLNAKFQKTAKIGVFRHQRATE